MTIGELYLSKYSKLEVIAIAFIAEFGSLKLEDFMMLEKFVKRAILLNCIKSLLRANVIKCAFNENDEEFYEKSDFFPHVIKGDDLTCFVTLSCINYNINIITTIPNYNSYKDCLFLNFSKTRHPLETPDNQQLNTLNDHSPYIGKNKIAHKQLVRLCYDLITTHHKKRNAISLFNENKKSVTFMNPNNVEYLSCIKIVEGMMLSLDDKIKLEEEKVFSLIRKKIVALFIRLSFLSSEKNKKDIYYRNILMAATPSSFIANNFSLLNKITSSETSSPFYLAWVESGGAKDGSDYKKIVDNYVAKISDKYPFK